MRRFSVVQFNRFRCPFIRQSLADLGIEFRNTFRRKEVTHIAAFPMLKPSKGSVRRVNQNRKHVANIRNDNRDVRRC